MLKDKIIFITGGSRGIGRATALLAAENHAQVIINYNRGQTEAEGVVAAIQKKGLRASMVQGDVSNEDDVKRMFSEIKKQYAGIDILVNNAGIMKNNLLLMTKTEEFDQLVDVNCKGVFLCTRQASKIMLKQKTGKVINLASIVGRYGNNGQTVYSATKSFVIGFTKSSAKELGRFGITVNAVAPGFIETDLTEDTSAEIRKELLSCIPLGRFGTPDDVAKVILFLSSDLGNYVSGQVIGVDGSQIM